MPTLEVRWFFPESKATRPTLFGPDHTADSRTDWYVPANPASGVKLRDQRLEVKLLLEERGVWTFDGVSSPGTHSASPAGRVELWNKWIYVGPASPTDSQFAGASWLPVAKRRWLTTFTLAGGALQVATDRPENGCQAEWTEVAFAGRDWLTVGFEAFGSAEGLEDRLRSVAEHVLPQLPAVLEFTPEGSWSYPAWLVQNSKPESSR